VIDVANGRIITSSKEDVGFALLLEAEALAFMTIWNAITRESSQLAKRASA
jgi:hypothetical protein